MEQDQLLDLVRNCSEWDGYTFDPGTHLRAVNALRTLEKAEALALLRAYLEEARANGNSLQTSLFLLLRLLFEPESGENFPTIPVGKPVDPGEPYNPAFPLYPLALVQDVPLLISTGFILAGHPGSPEAHLKFCEEKGRLRREPLSPPDNPLDLAGKLVDSPEWYRPTTGVEAEDNLAIYRAQLLRLVSSVYSPGGDTGEDLFNSLVDEKSWQRHREAFLKLGAKWSEQQNDYILPG